MGGIKACNGTITIRAASGRRLVAHGLQRVVKPSSRHESWVALYFFSVDSPLRKGISRCE